MHLDWHRIQSKTSIFMHSGNGSQQHWFILTLINMTEHVGGGGEIVARPPFTTVLEIVGH